MNEISLVRVIQSGFKLTSSKRLEDPVRIGRNAWLTSIFQLSAVQSATAQADCALKLAGCNKVPFAIRSLLYVTPPFIAAVVKKGVKNDSIRLALFLFQEHIGTVCQVAFAICSLVFIYFGNSFGGGISLIILGIGFLDRRNLLPNHMPSILHRYIEPFIGISGLFTNINFEFFLFAGQLLLAGAGRYLIWKKSREKAAIIQQEITKGRLHYKNLLEILSKKILFRVNRDYVHYFHMGIIQDIDIAELDALFNTVNWQIHRNALRAKLKNDPRFVEKYGNPDKKMDEELISYVRTELHGLVNGVKERTIFQDNPQDFEMLKIYLTHTIKILIAIQKEETLWVDVIMRLGIEAGGYCDQGRLEVVEDTYRSLMGLDHITPLKARVFHFLQQERMKWVQRFYTEAQTQEQWHFIHHMIDWNDRHTYTQTMNALFGDAFGLQRSDIDDESIAIVEKLTRLFMGWARSQVIDDFWEEHTVANIVETIQLAIGSSQLPKTDIYQWWIDWGNRGKIPDKDKESFQEELAEAKLMGKPLEVAAIIDGRRKFFFIPESIQAMLFDMGVLELADESKFTGNPFSY